MPTFSLSGWIECDGTRLSEEEIQTLLSRSPENLRRCGGEFLLRWNDCVAQDHFGILRGDCPPGTILCGGVEQGTIEPDGPLLPLHEAIETAVRLRSDEGVVAFSGGVDSALVAALAHRPCVTVGLAGSHDLLHATAVAKELGLDHSTVVIAPSEIAAALKAVLPVVPQKSPVDVSIATTLWFVARYAREEGYVRILAGQGADELFGGYARYLERGNLAALFEKDFLSLAVQGERDQAVAGLFGTYFSEPFLDVRVVRAAQAIAPEERVKNGVGKYPLREVACRYMPKETALYGKKAMQYGSGIWKEIQRLTRQNGYKKSVQEYLSYLDQAE